MAFELIVNSVIGSIVNRVIAVLWNVLGPVFVHSLRSYPYLLKSYLDNQSKKVVSANRGGIAGRWEGTVCQESGPDNEPIEYTAVVYLTVRARTVSGMLVTNPRGKNPRFDESRFIVSGEIQFARFLQLNYIPCDKSATAFGSVVLEYNANVDELNGGFVGFGKTSQRIIWGTVTAEKKA